MSPDLDDTLCKKYPKIFKNRDGSIKETCMAWGFECGDGWYGIIDTLCCEIQNHIDWKSRNASDEEKDCLQVVADQVKEKFGTLRFYYTGGDETIEGMVSMAEGLTKKTCEDCGCPGSSRGGGWIRTLCDTCDNKKTT